MHLVGLLVLIFVPCCISRAVNDNLEKTVNGLKGIEPLEDAANYATEQPPVNGAGDEGTRKARDNSRPEREQERDTNVNGQVNGIGYGTHEAINLDDLPVVKVGEDEGKQYRARDERDVQPRRPPPPHEWSKYTDYTSWCTVDGRSIIDYNIDTAAECYRRCVEESPGCIAVEYWEEYNDACFECTDTSLITAYTNTNDLAYPVYVWTRAWKKVRSETSWCTVDGRTEISMDTNEPIDHIECQKRCEAIEGCNAIEFWETYNYACFQCTDLSLIEDYTNTNDLAYPVYVWARGPTA